MQKLERSPSNRNEGGNLPTLWDKALSPESIPEYPTYELARAIEGDITFELDSSVPNRVAIRKRDAVPGELLRDSTLKFIADWSKNVKFRGEVMAGCLDNEEAQEFQRVLCKSSILYFANVFCWTFDDRLIGTEKTVPFISYPFQDDVLTWILWLMENSETGVAEKSRDMGLSWIAAIVSAYLALLYKGMNSKFMSMNEPEVDDRTTDSLLGKVRFILNNGPSWMRGGWVERGLRDDISMKLTIPDTGSTIKGILSKGTAGRSGRTAILISDEWAHVEDSTKVLKAVSELTNCKLFISSANGKGNEMYTMREDLYAILKSLHWKLHPLKNDDWATARKSKPEMTEETWAQEQDINYEGSTIGRVFPQFISFPMEGVWCHVREGELVEYDSAYDVYSVTDLGTSDPCSTLWAQIKPAPPELQNFTLYTLVFFAEHEARDMTAYDLRYILNERSYHYREHIVDIRTGHQRDSSGKTWVKNLADPDVKATRSKYLNQIILPGPPIHATGKRSGEKRTLETFRTQLNLQGAIAVSKTGCPNFINSLQNWRFPLDRNTRQPLHDSSPEHSKWSHSAKAGLYLVDFLYGKGSGDKEDGDWQFPAYNLNNIR